jgi:hypothetical protein
MAALATTTIIGASITVETSELEVLKAHFRGRFGLSA